ncbi:MAG: FAD-dependent oxidoreductase, partial [Candidatus Micrarchaeaceae archaeon]
MVEEIIIIGAGPAGYTAAIYAGRDGFKPLVISGLEPGGQLLLTTTVENYPGFPDGIDGSQLMDLFRKQAEKFGARFVFDEVASVDFSAKPFKIKTGSSEYEARSVIIATGAKAKWLGIESEKKFIGKGVSSCATCDAAFFKNKNVIVVGGGDTAMEDSLYLTNFASSVTIVHRRDQFRASKIMQDRVFANPKIKVIWNSVVDEVLGSSRV